MLSPGTQVGVYRVTEHVGEQGTTADVYRAHDGLGLDVALKLLCTPTSQARREADVVIRLRHPLIVRTYEVIEYDDHLCLVQEWVDGPSLETVLAGGRTLDLAETLRLGRALASALAYAHSRGVLHRDIKPSNVLLADGVDYKLVDFGAAGTLDADTGRTRAGQIAGTPLYMSPEQSVGASQTPASDVFGLGLLMYRCLHGTTPGETSDNYLQLIVGRAGAPIAVPPSPLQDFLQRCLAADPAQRPQTAQAVLEELSLVEFLAPTGFPPFVRQGQLRKHGQVHGPQHPSGQWPVPGQGPGHLPAPLPRARRGSRMAVLAGVAVAVLGLLIAVTPGGAAFWLRVGAGVVIVVTALLVAHWVRGLVGRSPDLERRAAGILTGADSRAALTESMVLEVDQVVARLKGLDARFLGLTMVLLIREAEEARESADRVAALVQMVTLMEKLTKQLSPWYVRHKDAIALGIAIVGSLAGLASVVSGFLR